MKYTARIANGHLVQYANFEDGTHINLIRLKEPYKNGTEYAIHSTVSGQRTLSLSKNEQSATAIFDRLVFEAQQTTKLITKGKTEN